MQRKFVTMFGCGVLTLFSLAFNAQAQVYTGGDWSGKDFFAKDGDYLSGSFTNMDEFVIPLGVTVFAGSDTISISSRLVTIDGIFDLREQQDPSLTFVVGEGIFVNGGSILAPTGTKLTLVERELPAGFTLVEGTFSVSPGGDISWSAPSSSAVPLPGALWLLGSGFAGLVVAQRKKQ